MEQKLRDACDACHIKKVKCASNGIGACYNCRINSTSCTYSPRDQMGRPTKNNKDTRRKRPTAKPVQPSTKQVPQAPQVPEVDRTFSSTPSLSSGSSTQSSTSLPSNDELDSSMFVNMDFDTELPDFNTSPSFFNNAPFSYSHSVSLTDLNTSGDHAKHMTWDSLLIDPYESPVDKLVNKAVFQTPPSTASLPPSKNRTPPEQPRYKPTSPEYSPPSPTSGSAGSSAALCTFLCNVMFALRSYGGQSWRIENTTKSENAKELFDLVSKFCNVILEEVIPHCGRSTAPQDVAISNIVKLITTIICLVVNAYSVRLDAVLRGSKQGSQGIEQNPSSLSSRRTPSIDGPSAQLDNLIQLTVMDYHILQLRTVVNHLNRNDSLQPIMKSAGDCMIGLEHLRAQVNQANKGVKSLNSDMRLE